MTQNHEHHTSSTNSWKNFYIYFLVLFTIFTGTKNLEAQSILSDAIYPTRLQFYARESNDSASIKMEGSIDSTGYDSVVSEVKRGASLYNNQSFVLNYSSGKAKFQFFTKIRAGLYEYHFRLYLYQNGSRRLIRSADSIVCGDVYMINGQSNSHPTDANATYKNEYCRSFGVQTQNANYDNYQAKDTLWGLANGDGLGNAYCGPLLAGVWGIKLMQTIKEKYKMPICIINGGSGGSSIEYNIEYNKNDLTTSYGRLYYRLRKAGLANKVKAIFWHQGESNTNASFTTYTYYFDSLYHSWKRDYPSAKKIYVFQIHHGCGGNNQSEIREIQRNFKKSYADVEVMSTVGLKEHDGCHYYLNGYYEMAANIYRLVARDLYGSNDTVDINPPNLLKAFYLPGNKTIKLIFDNTNNLVWPADTLGQKMINYFYLDTAIAGIKNYILKGNSITLNLNNASNQTLLSYLPNVYNNYTNTLFQGPYIRNKRGIGALSFYNFPIDTIPPPVAAFSVNTTSFCQGDSLNLIDQSLYQPTKWQWILSGGHISDSTAQHPKVLFDSSGLYQIKLKVWNAMDVDSVTKNITIKVHPKPSVSAGADATICKGDSIHMQVSKGVSYLWLPAAGLNMDSVSDPIASPNTTTTYIARMTDANGCSNADTVQVFVIPYTQIHAGADLKICNNGTIVNLSGAPVGGVWTGAGLIGSQFDPQFLSAGNYFLIYEDTNFCGGADTLIAQVIQAPNVVIDSVIPKCAGELVSVKANTFYTNYLKWSTTTGGYFNDDTSAGTTYSMSSQEINNGYIYFNVKAIGDSLCGSIQATQLVKILSKPVVPFIYEKYDTLYTVPADRWQWYVDGSVISGAQSQRHHPLKNGMYTVKVSNADSCEEISTPYFYFINGIGSQATALDGYLYPNPANESVTFSSNVIDPESVFLIYDYSGKLVWQQRSDRYRFSIDLRSFPDGVYMLTSSGVSNRTKSILVVQHH